MKVDRVLVGKIELDETERIVRPRLLAQPRRTTCKRLHTRRRRGQGYRHITCAAYDLKMLRCKIGRVGPDLRQLFPQQDATGHIPIGPEDDRFHVRDKYWRASTREGAADDHV